MIEQRKAQRFDLELPFEIIRPKSEHAAWGETKNVSSSGVLFASPIPVDVGQTIEFVIILTTVPSTATEVRLRCTGTVVRSEDRSTFAVNLKRYRFVRIENRQAAAAGSGFWQSAGAWLTKLGSLTGNARTGESSSKRQRVKSPPTET